MGLGRDQTAAPSLTGRADARCRTRSELGLSGAESCATRDGVIAAPGLDPGQEVPHEPMVSALDHEGRRESLSGVATQQVERAFALAQKPLDVPNGQRCHGRGISFDSCLTRMHESSATFLERWPERCLRHRHTSRQPKRQEARPSQGTAGSFQDDSGCFTPNDGDLIAESTRPAISVRPGRLRHRRPRIRTVVKAVR